MNVSIPYYLQLRLEYRRLIKLSNKQKKEEAVYYVNITNAEMKYV